MIRFSKNNIAPLQDQEHLIVLLFDSAIEYMKLAIKALDRNDYKAKIHYLNKAKIIINELDEFLDMEDGGKLAVNLHRLYDFIDNNLTQASFEFDSQLIREAISISKKLNEKWKTVVGN